MNRASHEQALVSRSCRADKLQNLCKDNQEEHPHSWALDKTGTIRTLAIEYMEVEQQEKDEVFNIEVPDKVLQVHDHAPPSKAERMLCLIYKNINGICNRLSNNEKLEKARSLHAKLEVDIVAYCEYQLNMRHKANCNGFN